MTAKEIMQSLSVRSMLPRRVMSNLVSCGHLKRRLDLARMRCFSYLQHYYKSEGHRCILKHSAV
jgi:hypothetical protein